MVAIAVIAGMFPAAAGAGAGDLDPSFSTDGKVSLVSAGPFVARAVAVQADGRILVGGYSCTPGPSKNGLCASDGDSSFRVARFTPDGGLDSEWGDGGLVTTPVGKGRSQIFDLLVTDGGIVAGGVARDEQGRDTFAMVRYDNRGAVDTSFGDKGAVFTAVGKGFSAIADLAPGPDGTIVAVGQAEDDADRARMALARYRPDGHLDGSFGPFGTAFAGSTSYGYGLGAWVAPDGALMAAGIAGASDDPATYRTGIVRIGSGGAPDPGFDGDGSAEFAPGSSSSFANAITGLPDGRWLTAGAATDGEGRQVMALTRGLPDGTLDTSWDGDGVALIRTLGGAVANDVLRLPDGRAIVTGQAATGSGGYLYALVRLTDGGQIDTAFGGGVVTTQWTRFAVARATAGVVDADGRLLATGIGCLDGEGAQCDNGTVHLTLARYLGDPPAPAPAEPRTPPIVPAADMRAPFVKISPLPRRMSRRTFSRRGLLVRATPDEEATLTFTLRSRKGRKTVVLARRTLPYAAGRRTLRLKPARKQLPRSHRYSVQVEVRVADRARNAATVRRSVAMR
jgi:uncharacterized delta-60 repeat protein